MAKRTKRKPDMRRVRPTKTYTLPEVAKALDRSVGTVRTWIREGLPALDHARPTLVDGKELKEWLKVRWATRKSTCKAHELYCFSCRAPRTPCIGSVFLLPRNAKLLLITGNCSQCGCAMNKGCAQTRVLETEECFRPFMGELPHLLGHNNRLIECEKQLSSMNAMPSNSNQINLTESPSHGDGPDNPLQ